MNNDLISRSALMQSLRGNILVDLTPNLEQPTVYDVNRVVWRLEERKKHILEEYAEKLKRMYPIYYRLDSETKKIVSEIAKKYPHSVERVACIFLMCGQNQEETEKYIMRELTGAH